jgi:soluble lytic murein transglycosylase-like protein
MAINASHGLQKLIRKAISRAWLGVMGAAILGMVYSNLAQGAPFVRLCKQGVIYYYFSDQSDCSPNYFNKMPAGPRPGPPRSFNKLSPQELEPWIKWASQSHKVPDSLIRAVIKVESNFNPAATSPKGAQGLMQLMPGTAAQLQVSNPYDIRENIWAGTRYLGMLLEKFNHNLTLALAAYNAGPQRVEKCQTVPNIKETQGFVRSVCANFVHYSKASQP